MHRIIPALAVVAFVVAPVQGQTRRATIRGGGDYNQGKCTIEVVVDGAAEVWIHGDTATLRNVSGRRPEWRRFECTGPMPANPAGFRFEGVDGRGRQSLVRDPRRGGAAVVLLEDPDGGAEGYTFDILWAGGSQRGYPQGYGYDQPRYDNGPAYGGAYDQRGDYPSGQALGMCRDEVRRRAQALFGTADLDFQDMRIDDNRGHRDSIVGAFFLRRDRDRDTAHQFVCSVDLDRGRVRSVDIDPGYRGQNYGSADRMGAAQAAVQTCQREVGRRIAANGYRGASFDRINVDDRAGRNDMVVGSVTAQAPNRIDRFDFACRVDLNDGDVRSVDLQRR